MAKEVKITDMLTEIIVKGMQEKKASDIVKIDLRDINASVTDVFVICHGDSDRQVKAIADSIEEETRNALKEKPVYREGDSDSRWVLLDYINVVAHVFQKEARDFYELEDLWHDGKFTRLENQ